MKRQSFKPLCAALLCASFLASCQDYSPSDELIIRQKATTVNYEKAFHQAFPVIDPEQNWGFGPMPICGADVDITRGMNTNSNEWESVYHYEVPGGLSENGNAPWGWSAGDISNYERAYVYWWFSTHQWPKPLEVHWSEFFIENVWGQPEHSNKTGDPQSSSYVGSSGHLGMDYLRILDIGKTPLTPPNSPFDNKITDEASALAHAANQLSESDYEHVNNFNSTGGTKEQVMYAFEVSTEDFYHQETHGTSETFHNNWTVRYINGNYYLGFDYWSQKKGNEGYDNGVFSLIKPDGYYNDWIIKLSSGKHVVDSYTRRIMCEDLGNTFDWDFNDLVFDVTVYNGQYGNGGSGYYAQITLQAAGGTLPIYIGQKDEAHEAHFLFGVPTTTPVNVDAVGGVNRPAVVFHLPLDNSYGVQYDIHEEHVTVNGESKLVLSFDPNQIPIYVTRSDMTDPATADNYKLTAVKGQAPQKFACPCDTYWMKEFQNIEGIEGKQAAGHPDFAKWVAGTVTNEDDAFITERKKDKGNFTVLYADANGSPNSVSYSEDGNVGTIVPWKDLWNSTFSDPLNAKFTQVRSYPMYVNPDGTDNTDNNGYTTFSTTFEAQAPYIYETVEADDDPTAYSSQLMRGILEGGHANHEVVWSPNAKTVTLESNDGSKGYVLGSGYYTGGKNVLIQAVPRKFKEFDRWEDEDAQGEKLVSRDANYTITNISANKHYKAHFKDKGPSRVNVQIVPEGSGYICIDDHQDAFQSGTQVPAGQHSFGAYCNEGYVFEYWNDDEDDWYWDKTVDVDGEEVITLVAHFREALKSSVSLTPNDANYGSVRLRVKGEDYNSGSGEFFEGVMVQCYATPNIGNRFVNWTDNDGGVVGNQSYYSFYLGEDLHYLGHVINLTANFEPLQYLATLNGPFNNGYDLLANVPDLSNYNQCYLWVTYSGEPVFVYSINHEYWVENKEVRLPRSEQTTTDFVVVSTNQLKVNSVGNNISQISIWVKP